MVSRRRTRTTGAILDYIEKMIVRLFKKIFK